MSYDEQLDEPLFEADPVLGDYIANYPSDRLRLLIQGGAVLLAVWFVVTVLLWQVEENIAAILTVIIMGVVTWGVGWYITHLWNREVVLYERGFSYREGSYTAFFKYGDVLSIRQQGQRVAYFGGLIRRSTLRFTIMTDQDEHIILTPLYRHVEPLTLRLEAEITRALQPHIQQQLDQGVRVSFGETLALSQQGLHENGRDLLWSDFVGYHVGQGRLTLDATQAAGWYSVKLGEVDNLRLLVELLKQRNTV